MTANAAGVEDADNVAVPEPVSGWSLFWALIAISSHAMLQVSFSGYLWNGDSFQGSWTYRSSPFICLIDGVADACLGLRALCTRVSSSDEQGPRSGRKGALIKLALFGLGVLPQAIKLFSMQGIPKTQVIAAMYLLPSTISLVRSLSSESPEEDIQMFLGSLAVSAQTVLINIINGAWLANLVAIYVFWYDFGHRVGFSASEDVRNAINWIQVALVFSSAIYIIQHMIFALFKKRSPVSCFASVTEFALRCAWCYSGLDGMAS
jgi:hypothetical protein